MLLVLFRNKHGFATCARSEDQGCSYHYHNNILIVYPLAAVLVHLSRPDLLVHPVEDHELHVVVEDHELRVVLRLPHPETTIEEVDLPKMYTID